MTSAEVASLALTVHAGSFVLSLPAVYAVFGDRLVLPSLDRARDICAKLRGKLAIELDKELSLVLGRDDRPTTARAVLDDRGEPAQITSTDPHRSERFRNALRKFLDSQSDDFCRYHSAMRWRRIMYKCWNGIRIFAAFWPIFALAGIIVFGAFSRGIFELLAPAWLWAIGGILALPLIVLLVHSRSLRW